MARDLRWTETAAEDLEETARYIARDSPAYARIFVREVLAAVRSLHRFPERGRLVPEARADPSMRELFVKSHRLLYRVTDRAVFVVGIVHGARDLPALWHRYDGEPR